MSFRCGLCGKYSSGSPTRIATWYRPKVYPARSWETGKDEFKVTHKDPGGAGIEIVHEEDICADCNMQ